MLKSLINGSTAIGNLSDKKSQIYIGKYFGQAKPAKFDKLTTEEQKKFFDAEDTIKEMQKARTIVVEIAKIVGYTLTKEDALEENGTALFYAMLNYIADLQK